MQTSKGLLVQYSKIGYYHCMTIHAQQLELIEKPTTKDSKKRVQGGISTTDVVMSAFIAGNAEIFPKF